MKAKQYSESHWRNHAAPIIRRILEATAGKAEREVRRALRKAYPFGQRKYHPYRIWCDEIARQRGRKPPLGSFTPKASVRVQAENPNQAALPLPERTT